MRWLAVPGMVLLLNATACATEDEPPAEHAVEGDVAVWSIPRGSRLTASTTSFTASVSRLDCNSGVTGTVLEPRIEYRDLQVIVSFDVERAPDGAADCQGNPEVPYDVVLSEPLGGRELVDGACLSNGEAEGTSFCSPDGVRWPR